MDRKLWALALAAGVLLAGCGAGEETQPGDKIETAAADPYARTDQAWIRISGSVENVAPDTFTLNYGEGAITVEMDDGDRDADAYKLLEGDKVTVSGRIDDDFMEARSIEAASVYVEKLGTWFHASSLDDEDTFVAYWHPIAVSKMVVQGRVVAVGEKEISVDTGITPLVVELDELPRDLLDDEGYPKIEVGDRVSVTGTMDNGLFEGPELVADSLVKLST